MKQQILQYQTTTYIYSVTFVCMLMLILLTIVFADASLIYAQDRDAYRNFGQDFTRKLQSSEYRMPEGPYEPNLESLSNHQAVPEWFRDAKFGIYAHWGVYSVSAFHGWYPYHMYNKESHVYEHHVTTYGSPLEFGYPDFVPMFTGEKFDAGEWAKLFKEAGARFAGPVAEHHDGFAMWDSEWTPWDAVERGPRRDIVAELEQAIRKEDMRFITTFHHSKNNLREQYGEWEGHFKYVKLNFPSLLEDPERAIMYGYLPKNIFYEMWLGKLEETINKYKPDLMWFDGRLGSIPDSVKTKYLAYYLNKADQQGKDVAVTYKHDQLPYDIGIQDFERGRAKEIIRTPWLTDDSIADNYWIYTPDLELKSSAQIIHNLVDIVSKNGQLLLNVLPKADGSIPENQQQILRDIGGWLDQNGEAIYGTRHWKTFGEGPTRLEKGGSFVKNISYTPEDIRYTRKGDTIYAIVLGWPGADEKLLLTSWEKNLHWGMNTEIESISLLGMDENIDWEWPKKGLILTTPSQAPNEKAIVFKINTKHH